MLVNAQMGHLLPLINDEWRSNSVDATRLADSRHTEHLNISATWSESAARLQRALLLKMVQPSFSDPTRADAAADGSSPTAPLDRFLDIQPATFYETIYQSEASCLCMLR